LLTIGGETNFQRGTLELMFKLKSVFEGPEDHVSKKKELVTEQGTGASDGGRSVMSGEGKANMKDTGGLCMRKG